MGAKKTPAELIKKISEAMEKTQYYQGIVNAYQDGEADGNLDWDEAERLAESWANDLDALSDESNIHIDTLWGTFDILVPAAKLKQIKIADLNRHKGKLQLRIA